MFLTRCTALVMACAAILSTGYASANTAATPNLTPHVNLNDKLFNDPAPVEGGWDALANLLGKLTPSVDTSLPLSASDITRRISQMLNQGQNQEALDIIRRRDQQREAQGAIGTDVQLMLLEGRALSALGRHNEAIEVYRTMTTRFPELPEPWNNLAAEYVRQGHLDLANDALNMALTANPNYAQARENLGLVLVMLAREAFVQAGLTGRPAAAERARQLDQMLQQRQ